MRRDFIITNVIRSGACLVVGPTYAVLMGSPVHALIGIAVFGIGVWGVFQELLDPDGWRTDCSDRRSKRKHQSRRT